MSQNIDVAFAFAIAAAAAALGVALVSPTNAYAGSTADYTTPSSCLTVSMATSPNARAAAGATASAAPFRG